MFGLFICGDLGTLGLLGLRSDFAGGALSLFAAVFALKRSFGLLGQAAALSLSHAQRKSHLKALPWDGLVEIFEALGERVHGERLRPTIASTCPAGGSCKSAGPGSPLLRPAAKLP